MSFEILVGIEVTDNKTYNEYREAMKPILLSYEGKFCYDFVVSEVLTSQTEGDINRVFTLNFPQKKDMEGFFSNKEYLEVKSKFFDKSVGNTQIISSYDK